MHGFVADSTPNKEDKPEHAQARALLAVLKQRKSAKAQTAARYIKLLYKDYTPEQVAHVINWYATAHKAKDGIPKLTDLPTFERRFDDLHARYLFDPSHYPEHSRVAKAIYLDYLDCDYCPGLQQLMLPIIEYAIVESRKLYVVLVKLSNKPMAHRTTISYFVKHLLTSNMLTPSLAVRSWLNQIVPRFPFWYDFTIYLHKVLLFNFHSEEFTRVGNTIVHDWSGSEGLWHQFIQWVDNEQAQESKAEAARKRLPS
jgi:hypothetical protein